ncbi:uroporphyrinogen decarboxylase [Bartonella sp. TP]|uniref:uroporphyrinogen decarboxylase n=1 Tax=Bartonella sp. TP TaxID=3057550 RepID=UPI0025AF1B37|nr:uroporphyrinogen decarboxylase [Bartonella sp. TP]WJW79490.1 uroporphyrinogen decarboxylase [Bartonella sp. TP]
MSILFQKARSSSPPIWLMRQAGRYLPEYRALRSQQNSFLDLCYNSKIAFEISIQPIKRFDFDAAILFSDILVVPHALGFNLEFIPDFGPKLQKITFNEIVSLSTKDLHLNLAKLQPIFETVSMLREFLPANKDVIGFCGAPWTVASYMIAGKSTPDQAPARLFSMQHKKEFLQLLDLLTQFSALYLIEQIKAGANLIQIFDSWAGILSQKELQQYCIEPTAKLINLVKKLYPDIPIIVFPKGIDSTAMSLYVEQISIDGLSVDWRADFSTLKKLQDKITIQGNLDPLCLISGGKSLEQAIDEILLNLANKDFIFNLGHGILPQTPLANVELLINKVRNYNIC